MAKFKVSELIKKLQECMEECGCDADIILVTRQDHAKKLCNIDRVIACEEISTVFIESD